MSAPTELWAGKSGIRVAVGDCSVTERRRLRPPHQTGKTVRVHAILNTVTTLHWGNVSDMGSCLSKQAQLKQQQQQKSFTVKILKFGTAQTIAIIVLK